MIDAEGVKNQFGYMGHAASGGKTAAGCEIRFSERFLVEWEEDGTVKRAPVNVLKYEKKKAQIQSFIFTYLGTNQWKLTAHNGQFPETPEVVP